MNAAKSRLTLDENHVYRLDGRVIPGVTEILKDVGLSNHFNNDGWYLGRGRAVHLAVEYYLDGDLKQASVHTAIKGHLDAFMSAHKELGFEVIASEEPVFDDVRWYAGTMDLLVKYEGNDEVWDIKTGGPEDWHRFQTAAYAGARFRSAARYYKRRGLYLKEDGSFKQTRDLKVHNNPDDFVVFYSAVNIFHAKKR